MIIDDKYEGIALMMKQLTILIIIGLSGCASINPIFVAEHTSHSTQHVGSNRTNYGWNSVGVGVRVRHKGLTLDVTESYTPERVNGRHEIFQARLLWEMR